MPEIPESSQSKVEDCQIHFSWDSAAVKPKPSVMCGVWNEKHGYILIGTKLRATAYFNGSFSNHFVDEIFEVKIIKFPTKILLKILNYSSHYFFC